MKRLLQGLALSFLFLDLAPAQCCLGARDLTVTSIDGTYRVEATSLTGTGVRVHGPYHYRFRYLRRTSSGDDEEVGSFEHEWNTDAHFTMQLFVSATGNGVAIEFPTDHLAFYTRDGFQTFDSGPDRPVELGEDEHDVILCRRVPAQGGGAWYVEDARVFLPLGSLVTDALDDQVCWFLALDERSAREAAANMEGHLRALASTEPGTLEKAREALLFGTYLSVGPLRKALENPSDEEHRLRLERVLSELRAWERLPLEGGWHDLPLLLTLGSYPDVLLAKRARRKVAALLSPSLLRHELSDVLRRKDLLDETMRWVQEHRNDLVWNAETKTYVRREGH